MKSFRQVRETSTASSSIVPQWLHKIAMKPKLKDMVRGYLNWRRKHPGQGRGGVQQAVKMMGLSPRDGNLLIDTLNDMVKQGKLPKHLALEACCSDCETDYSKNYKEFINFAMSDLGIKNKPKINITDKDLEGTFGYFEPHNNNITVSTRGRHQVDVMRTLAHELVHHKDRQAGKELDGADGSEDENNANAYGGVLLRKWASKKPHLFSESHCTDQWYDSQPEWGTNASTKKSKKMTPGQKESVMPTTAQIRLGRAAKKAGVGKNDDFYNQHRDPEKVKAEKETQKRPAPMQVKKPVGSFKWFATRDMKK